VKFAGTHRAGAPKQRAHLDFNEVFFMRTHRSLPLVGLLSCLLTASATEAAPFVGGHVGFGLGYVAGQDDGLEIPSDPTYAFSTKTEADGGLLSLSAGYDLLLASRWIAGLTIDAELRGMTEFTYQRLNGVPSNVDSDNTYEDPIKFTSNFATTLGPRLGYVLNDEATLIYTTAGISLARISRSFGCTGACSFLPTQPSSVTQTDWQTGWAVGMGLEHMVSAWGSVSIEYRHADFGTQLVDTSPLYPGAREHQEYSEDAVHVSLNYRF